MAHSPSNSNTRITSQTCSNEDSTGTAASHDGQLFDQLFANAARELNVTSDQMDEILRLDKTCRQFRLWPEGTAVIFLLLVSVVRHTLGRW